MDDRGRRASAEAAGRPGPSQCRECGDAWFLCRAGGGGNLVAWHHGRYTEGSGLRRARAPQLRNDRSSRSYEVATFFCWWRIQMRKLMMSMALLVLIGGPAAMAQGGNTGTSGAANQSQPSREAPVGHRQP